MSERQRVAERLSEAGLGTERFIDVTDGEKGSVDHEQHEPTAVSGNYGIYANGGDALVILDIDDYGDVDDKSGLAALSDLPATFEQGSPHDGTHRFYRVEPSDDGRLVAAALSDAFGANKGNLAPSWGEVRAHNQYVVGAGSQLDGCDKDWCDECAEPDGGYYVVQADREIATIEMDTLLDVLASDPVLSRGESDATSDSSTTQTQSPSPPDDVSERLEHAREQDDKLDRLMRGDYSDYNGDRSKAEYVLAFKLAFWLGDDKQTIASVLDHHARAEKWTERDDDSYRDSVLSAVDEQTEFYTPGHDPTEDSYSPDVDWDEVDRGKAILEAERGVTEPFGNLTHKDGCYGYWTQYTNEDGEKDRRFSQVTNFTLELEHMIQTYEGKLLTIRVYPSSPMEDAYTVEVSPTVFNSIQTFQEEVVTGRTTTFSPENDCLNDLRLTVGHQTAPEHVGTEYIGLHGDNYEEWVTPAGTLTSNGWADKPTHKYYEKGGNQEMESSLEDKWALAPDDGARFDEDAVADICERVPQTRKRDRGLPILGWFYAAPLKPIIHDIEGEFNLLQVTGDTEVGKTATLQLFYELFGADPAPFGCGDTNFTVEKKLAGSCGLPIWLDEYKPTDLDDRKLKWLHRRLREVTREKTISKGRTDLGEITFRMRAPVVFSGEQTVTEAAVRRRTVMTNLTNHATEGEHQQSFCELTGATFTDEEGRTQTPDGYNLHDHARAYYRYVLESDPEQFREAWSAAREKTRDHLRALDVPDLDGSEFQGLQTVVFGIAVFRQFADQLGADEAELPSDAEVRQAIGHIVSNIGPEGRRREHIDEFAELMAQAASNGYLEEGEHHRVYQPQMADSDALAFHMPTTFSAVKKYVREFNVESEYSLLGKNDYVDSFRDKAENGDSYPLAVNHRVRGLENGSKAVVIDPHRAAEILPDGFNLSAFTDDIENDEAEAEDGSDDDGDGATPLREISGESGYVTVEAEAAAVVDPKPWLQAEGTLDDGTAKVDYIARGDSNPAAFEQGEEYRITDAKVTTDESGGVVLELRDGATEVTATTASPDDATQSGLDSHDQETAADGGEELEGPAANVREHVRTEYGSGDELSAPSLAGELDLDPETAESALESLAENGRGVARSDGGYEAL